MNISSLREQMEAMPRWKLLKQLEYHRKEAEKAHKDGLESLESYHTGRMDAYKGMIYRLDERKRKK